jgi:hypothetical protein
VTVTLANVVLNLGDKCEAIGKCGVAEALLRLGPMLQGRIQGRCPISCNGFRGFHVYIVERRVKGGVVGWNFADEVETTIAAMSDAKVRPNLRVFAHTWS